MLTKRWGITWRRRSVGTQLEPRWNLYWNRFQCWNPARTSSSGGFGSPPTHLRTHMEGRHMMLFDKATVKNVYLNFSMFRRSSQPIQIAAARTMLMSAGAKISPLAGGQRTWYTSHGGGGIIPDVHRWIAYIQIDSCKQTAPVRRNKTRCLAGGPRTWYTSQGGGGGRKQSPELRWHLVLVIEPATTIWSLKNGRVRQRAQTTHAFMSTVGA